MMTLVALVACLAASVWSAASVASTIPDAIMSSGNASSPWNVTHAPIAGSNAIMSSYTDNAEERTIVLPEEFDSVLGQWELSRFPIDKKLHEKEQMAQAKPLLKRIKAMETEFSNLIDRLEKNPIFFYRKTIMRWVKYVKVFYGDNELAWIAMLLSHFQNDDKVVKELVAGAKADDIDRKSIANKLLAVFIKEWVNLKKDPHYVFKRLELNQASDVFNDDLFAQWCAFLKASYGVKEFEAALPVLVHHFKGDIALSTYLVEVKNLPDIARELLTLQLTKWGKAKGKHPKWIFQLLKIYNSEDNAFNKELFPLWVAYVKLITQNNEEALKTMYSILRDVCKDDLGEVLDKANKIAGVKVFAKKLKAAWIEELSEAQKHLNVELGEPSSQKRQKVGLKEPPAEIGLEPSSLKRQKVDGMKTVAKKTRKARNEGLPNVLKRHNVELGEPSSQKRQKVGSKEPPVEIAVSEPPVENDSELLSQKRQKVGSNEPPAENDLEPSRLKRQKSFDLNELPPETEVNSDLPPRED